MGYERKNGESRWVSKNLKALSSSARAQIPTPLRGWFSTVTGGSAPLAVVMAKDPAFLFYYQDFLVGTTFMSAEETGVYIRILCHLADKKKLTKDEITHICGSAKFSDKIASKFQQDKAGNFINKRLAFEVEKRAEYAKSRRANRLGKKHMNNTSLSYVRHMENENENENRNENNINESDFLRFYKAYPKKRSKGQAMKAWRTSKNLPDIETLLTAIEKAKLSAQWQKNGGEFIPYPATWLRSEGWEDEITETDDEKYQRLKRELAK